MGFLGLRKWSTPVMRPLWPFMAAFSLTYYLVSTAQNAAVKSEAFANDPRNPYALKVSKESNAHH